MVQTLRTCLRISLLISSETERCAISCRIASGSSPFLTRVRITSEARAEKPVCATWDTQAESERRATMPAVIPCPNPRVFKAFVIAAPPELADNHLAVLRMPKAVPTPREWLMRWSRGTFFITFPFIVIFSGCICCQLFEIFSCNHFGNGCACNTDLNRERQEGSCKHAQSLHG